MRKGIMLAKPFDAKIFGKMPIPFLVQPKLDGIRCRAMIEADGTVNLRSSQDKVINSVPHIRKALSLSDSLRDTHLDGELYVQGWNFQQLISVAKRTKNLHKDHESVVFHIFDSICSGPQHQRLQDLARIPKTKGYALCPVPTYEAHSYEEVGKYLDGFIADGYEGIIIRNRYGEYEYTRTSSLLKLKPTKRDTYRIIGSTEEIDKDGNPKDRLGALVCSNRIGGVFNVGTGFTQEQRIMLWTNKEELPGKIVVVKYQELTTNEIPRFPVLIEIKE